jgi:cobaltochelatase CobS
MAEPDGTPSMNAPELTEHEHLGLYLRNTDTGAEWWRVTVADRPQTYRLEHVIEPAQGNASVDIDLVADAENLRAKLKK